VDGLNWRKASYSGSGGGGCVEAASSESVVLVRDTTNRDGGTLTFSIKAWGQFTASLR
jgi:Domain of unknown function (DUF397)